MCIHNQKVLRTPGPSNKYFERLFCRSINNKYQLHFLKFLNVDVKMKLAQ